MDNKDVIKAVNILKDYCNDHNCFQNCILMKDRADCMLSSRAACNWKIPKSEPEGANSSSERIADLHREIELRDRKLEELEHQLAIKDDILRKQGVMIAELREEQPGC